ncbi:MAG: ribulose-phosphate 3-epimerase [Omnitrophica WOR_2 bacterium RIFCSPHIGHO2_02_FULL_67_20]|nr:MAG: ribulose-phosphate 3-epimerase [Omnitrophica WOR_2 bacterium RIFCSPHIGHO2_02_FULL_67_20]
MSARSIMVSPSLLACDFGRLAEEVRAVEAAGADWLHVDVMDGHFVPNLTVGPVVVEAIRRASRLPLDVHLMLNHPEQHVKPFIEAGAQYLTVHLEAPGLRTESVLRKTLDAIRALGARPGLSVRPRTSADALRPFLEAVDLVLLMTVEPGFGGQAFMPEVVPKVRQVREGFSRDLAVDGGINAETGRACREAGANVLVAGTYVFKAASYKDAIQSLRG